MLIINADDWGLNKASTDNSLACFRTGRITSASAMLFMADSDRAADLAGAAGLSTGLHLNVTQPFDGNGPRGGIAASQRRISRFLRGGRYRQYFYHPGLAADFERVFTAQYEEYVRLYRSEPAHFDGHHHMHLCANMLAAKLIPAGTRVRRNFTFKSGEKGPFNRFCRGIIDGMLTRRHVCTDYFYAFGPCWSRDRLREVVGLSRERNVELMVHPERPEEYGLLMSEDYLQALSGGV